MLAGGLRIWSLIYHSTVRACRQGHRNALMNLMVNIFQTVVFVAVFYMMFAIMGMRSAGLRGDFMMYILSGVFLFMVFNKSMMGVYQAEGPTSQMMKHANMNPIIAICAAALSALYFQTLSVALILFAYHIGWHKVEIDNFGGVLLTYLMTWATGAALGMMFLALKPWLPTTTQMMVMIYARVNMIASGKMFVANTLPGFVLVMFSWNPLFHLIDQARGFIFINYSPRFSNLEYPFWVMMTCLAIGLMGEFYTRKRASVSWQARS